MRVRDAVDGQLTLCVLDQRSRRPDPGPGRTTGWSARRRCRCGRHRGPQQPGRRGRAPPWRGSSRRARSPASRPHRPGPAPCAASSARPAVCQQLPRAVCAAVLTQYSSRPERCDNERAASAYCCALSKSPSITCTRPSIPRHATAVAPPAGRRRSCATASAVPGASASSGSTARCDSRSRATSSRSMPSVAASRASRSRRRARCGERIPGGRLGLGVRAPSARLWRHAPRSPVNQHVRRCAGTLRPPARTGTRRRTGPPRGPSAASSIQGATSSTRPLPIADHGTGHAQAGVAAADLAGQRTQPRLDGLVAARVGERTPRRRHHLDGLGEVAGSDRVQDRLRGLSVLAKPSAGAPVGVNRPVRVGELELVAQAGRGTGGGSGTTRAGCPARSGRRWRPRSP